MSTSPIPANIAEIAAPLLLGPVLNWMLYGVLIVQLYVYTYNFIGDRKLLKLLVYAVFLLETLQTALTGADLYYWFVSGFGSMDHLVDPYVSAFDVPIIGSIVSLTVQSFFAYRVWVLGEKKSWLLCMAICVCSLISAGAAFSGGVYTVIHHKFANGRALRVLALTWLTSTIMADMLIAATMLYHLTKLRSTGDGYFSDNALSRIVRLTIETNILTTTVAIVSLLMATIFPRNNWFTCPTAVLGKLYSNTLLVSLNNRIAIRDELTGRGAVTKTRPQAVMFRGTTPTPFRDATGSIYLGLEKVPHPLRGRTPSEDSQGPERAFAARQDVIP